MENLNAEAIKKALKDMNMKGVSPVAIRNAIALINELTQANEQLSESYDHLEKTKDELLSERARLAEENESLQKLCKLREKDHNDTLDLLYKEEKENERLKAELEKRPPRLVITKL